MGNREIVDAGWKRIFALLRSLRLTIPLLCSLSALAAAGSLWEPLRDRSTAVVHPVLRFLGLVDTWRSPLFLLLALLLVVNVALCTWHRFATGVRAQGKRRRTLMWLDFAVHFSLVAIIAGGVGKGVLGRVGTGYLFVGTPETSMFEEAADGDVSLGFSVLLEERRDTYYPLRLKVGVREAGTGEKVALLEVREGSVSTLPGGRLSLSIQEVRQNPGAAVLIARTAAGEKQLTLSLVAGADPVQLGPITLAAVAWRREIKSVRGRVKILEKGMVVREGWLEVNGAISHRGTSIFLTSWGADKFDNLFLGVQYRSDPAAFIFWAGVILLASALPPFVLLRRRRMPLPPNDSGSAP